MRRIAFVTGTRAEYGVSKNILSAIDSDESLELELIVTGAHLAQRYGYTVQEIEKDGFSISTQIPILIENSNENTMPEETALLIARLSKFFKKRKPDIVLIIGDRYEALAVAVVAVLLNIPIAHVSGGEITQGAIDNQIRHAITKMAHIHFPGMQDYANNILKMGEETCRVYMVGDPGIENLRLMKFLTEAELKQELGIVVDKDTLLVTYHPVTLEQDDVQEQINNLIEALSAFRKQIIFTYPNSDNGGNIIIHSIKEFIQRAPNAIAFQNLGSKKYLSIMKLCGSVIGNSSSAIIEAPYLKKPVVNIGNRQQGRIMASNIINCRNSVSEIRAAITKSLSTDFKQKAQECVSLYGDGNTAYEVARILKTIKLDEVLLKKK